MPARVRRLTWSWFGGPSAISEPQVARLRRRGRLAEIARRAHLAAGRRASPPRTGRRSATDRRRGSGPRARPPDRPRRRAPARRPSAAAQRLARRLAPLLGRLGLAPARPAQSPAANTPGSEVAQPSQGRRMAAALGIGDDPAAGGVAAARSPGRGRRPGRRCRSRWRLRAPRRIAQQQPLDAVAAALGARAAMWPVRIGMPARRRAATSRPATPADGPAPRRRPRPRGRGSCAISAVCQAQVARAQHHDPPAGEGVVALRAARAGRSRPRRRAGPSRERPARRRAPRSPGSADRSRTSTTRSSSASPTIGAGSARSAGPLT